MRTASIDAHEAVAHIVYQLADVIALAPPASSVLVGERVAAPAAASAPNVWGAVPEVVELTAPGAAIDVLRRASQGGRVAAVRTAPAPLLAMLPGMFELADTLTPAVIHVASMPMSQPMTTIPAAARRGGHREVMAARTTGFAMLGAGTAQEAHDFALVAQSATLRTGVPFVHFYDAARTADAAERVELVDVGNVVGMVRDPLTVGSHRRPTPNDRDRASWGAGRCARGRDLITSPADRLSTVVATVFDELAARTGRRYHVVDYAGHPDADRVIVMLGSGRGAASAAVNRLVADGADVGVVTVRLFRPFPAAALLAVLPPSVTSIAVLDRSGEPGAGGDPLFQDVASTLVGVDRLRGRLRLIGGHHGPAMGELTATMTTTVFDELAAAAPRRRFTVGEAGEAGESFDHASGTAVGGDSGHR